VHRNIGCGVVERFVRLERKVRRKRIDEIEQFIIDGKHLRVVAGGANLLEVVHHTPDDSGQLVSQNHVGHPSGIRKRERVVGVSWRKLVVDI
jgi:hypothetical protein